MRSIQRALSKLPPAGRHRCLAYWAAHVDDLPEANNDPAGPQQLDLEHDTHHHAA